MALQMEHRLAANVANLAKLNWLQNVLASLELGEPISSRGRMNHGHLVPGVEICFQAFVHRLPHARDATTVLCALRPLLAVVPGNRTRRLEAHHHDLLSAERL